ncbi:hypothetical protein PVNG_05555 [Plasmodium vivax North Korean]|uniref:VIR protein n=1 Tax=Plasmodium vivax North Korean TaxID=1035514 RepID=A0A0J9WEZ8_PLAVI|nr:hypothetical protein PVNG_05555 [Plasmodium vivax North Korean]
MQKLKEVWPNNYTNHNIFKEFASFLTQDFVLYTYGYPVHCTFINFLLNDQVKNIYSYQFESKFHLFQDFATKFVTESGVKGYSRNSCKNYLEDLGDEFTMSKILYKFYDLYSELISGTDNKTKKIPCNNINLIHTESYNAKNYIEKDKDFEKQLKELKILIQREKPYKDECNNYNILNFMLPDEIISPKVEAKGTERGGSIEGVSSRNVPHTDLGQRVDNREALGKSLLLSTENSPPKEKLQVEMVTLAAIKPSEDSNEKQLETVMPGRENLRTNFPQEEQAYRTWSPREHLDTVWEQETRYPGKESTSLDPKLYPLGDTHDIKGNTRGIFGTVGESVINVLGGVDPIPVVGVSGGMGALFLLFRVLEILNLHPYIYNIFK